MGHTPGPHAHHSQGAARASSPGSLTPRPPQLCSFATCSFLFLLGLFASSLPNSSGVGFEDFSQAAADLHCPNSYRSWSETSIFKRPYKSCKKLSISVSKVQKPTGTTLTGKIHTPPAPRPFWAMNLFLQATERRKKKKTQKNHHLSYL